jgi:hypothetical protein
MYILENVCDTGRGKQKTDNLSAVLPSLARAIVARHLSNPFAPASF